MSQMRSFIRTANCSLFGYYGCVTFGSIVFDAQNEQEQREWLNFSFEFITWINSSLTFPNELSKSSSFIGRLLVFICSWMTRICKCILVAWKNNKNSIEFNLGKTVNREMRADCKQIIVQNLLLCHFAEWMRWRCFARINVSQNHFVCLVKWN